MSMQDVARESEYSRFDDSERSFARDGSGIGLGRKLAIGVFGNPSSADALPSEGNLWTRISLGARNFLDAKSLAGKVFDIAIILLIVVNVCCMILYPDERGTVLRSWHDAAFRKAVFDTIESVSVAIFTMEWVARWLFATEDRGPRKAMFRTRTLCVVPGAVRTQIIARLRYTFSFFSLVDLLTILPYYVDLALTSIDLPSVQFIRVARLLRIFREGSWVMGETATNVRVKLLDQMYKARTVWYTAMFLGLVIWVVCSSLYYVAEKDNDAMIWDTYGDCKHYPSRNVNGTLVPTTATGPCVNRMNSIPSAMYFCLVNLFGEYPLADSHSVWGKVICSFVAVVAAIAVGIPAGLLGNGFQDAADEVEEENDENEEDGESAARASGGETSLAPDVIPTAADATIQASLFRLLHPDEFLVGDLAETIVAEDEEGGDAPICGRVVRLNDGSLALVAEGGSEAKVVDAHTIKFVSGEGDAANKWRVAGHAVYYFILALILLNIATIVADSIEAVAQSKWFHLLNIFEAISVGIFTLEYLARFVSVGADARFACCGKKTGGTSGINVWQWGRIRWMFTFYALVDLASILPFYVNLAVTGGIASTSAFVRTFRLLRLLKSPNAIEFLGVFGKTLTEHADVLIVTASFTGVLWILSSALMHYFERDNPDVLMSQYYQDIPSAMWITLLNLSGECPLCDFTVGGKIVTAIIGIFAVGIFGVPVGVFEAGFVDWAATEGLNLDDDDEDDDDDDDGDGEDEEGDGNEGEGADSSEPATSLDAVEIRILDDGETSKLSSDDAAANMPKSFRARLFDAMNNHGPFGQPLTIFIFALIFATITTACLGTVEGLKTGTAVTVFNWIEGICTVIFTIEYLLRLYIADEDPDFAWCHEQNAPCWFNYMFSFFSIVDLMAIIPWYFEIAGLVPAQMGDYLRMLRLLRLLKLDKYVPSVSLVDDIFRRNAQAFQVTGVVVGIVWIVFATLLYETTHNYTKKFMELTMGERYQNIPNSMQYAFIHLSGDYPFVDYTGWGRVVNFFIIVIAVAIVGVPIGLIANGFEDIIEEISEEGEEDGDGKASSAALNARINLETMHVTIHDERGAVVHRVVLDDEHTLVGVRDKVQSAMSVVASEQPRASVGSSLTPMDSSSLQSPDSSENIAEIAASSAALLRDASSSSLSSGPRNACRGAQEAICDFLEGDEIEAEGGEVRIRSALFTQLASLFQHFMLFLILLNVLLVLLETVDWITERTGTVWFDAIEWTSVVIFTLEFAFRLFAAPANPKYQASYNDGRRNRSLIPCGNGFTIMGSQGIYLTSFFGLVDVLSIFPSYISLILKLAGVSADPTIFRIFRLFRILELEHFCAAFTLIDDACEKKGFVKKMSSAGVLALIIWIGCGGLFYIFENGNPQVEGAFANIPDSMYYVAVFLGGEWCHCDFTIPGKLLCIWLVAAGIGLFGIPVGALFDAFEEVITESSEQAQREADAAVAATVDAIFEEYDADADGTVDAKEMSALVHDDPAIAFMLFPAWSHTSPTEEEKERFIAAVFSEKVSFSKADVALIIGKSSTKTKRLAAALRSKKK